MSSQNEHKPINKSKGGSQKQPKPVSRPQSTPVTKRSHGETPKTPQTKKNEHGTRGIAKAPTSAPPGHRESEKLHVRAGIKEENNEGRSKSSSDAKDVSEEQLGPGRQVGSAPPHRTHQQKHGVASTAWRHTSNENDRNNQAPGKQKETHAVNIQEPNNGVKDQTKSPAHAENQLSDHTQQNSEPKVPQRSHVSEERSQLKQRTLEPKPANPCTSNKDLFQANESAAKMKELPHTGSRLKDMPSSVQALKKDYPKPLSRDHHLFNVLSGQQANNNTTNETVKQVDTEEPTRDEQKARPTHSPSKEHAQASLEQNEQNERDNKKQRPEDNKLQFAGPSSQKQRPKTAGTAGNSDPATNASLLKIKQLEMEIVNKNKDLEEANRKLAQCEKAMGDMELKDKEQQERIDDLTNRLASEMSTKISSDESSLENINVGVRPMTVADEYKTFCSDDWLECCGLLEEECNIEDENERYHILCDLLMICEKVTKQVYGRVLANITASLSEPVKSTCSGYLQAEPAANSSEATDSNGAQAELPDSKEAHKELPDSKEAHKELPDSKEAHKELPDSKEAHKELPDSKEAHKELPDSKEFISLVKDQHRIHAGKTDLTILVKEISGSVKQKYPDIDVSNLHEYITAAARLTWKMIVQKPAMEFDVSGTEHALKHNLPVEMYFGSNTKADNPIVRYYVHPTLYHAEQVMMKGKVMVL